GLSIHYKDLTKGAVPEKYQILHSLYSTGIKGLFDFAASRYGFAPKENYTGKCDLCYHIRRYLVKDIMLDLPDLQPSGHYLYM
ncbi:MAG: radical SAM protein, partial [Firmicutes bacterium]|nr:radical SAM protein [Bacillota bacterium]